MTKFRRPDNSVKFGLLCCSLTIAFSSFFASLLTQKAGVASPDETTTFVKIESAKYSRGSDPASGVMHEGRRAQSGADWDEGPPHSVEVSSFRIATKQVTMKQFAAFLPGYRQRIEGRGLTWADDLPAVFVDWNEATAYCEWVSKNSNQPCRLPTEAEWELAALQNDTGRLSGIADGIQEWCHDWWEPYSDRALKNPHGPNSGSVRVVRDGGGGSVEEEKLPSEMVADFRISDRSATVPDDRRTRLGFRIVLGEFSDSASKRADSKIQAPFENVHQGDVVWDAAKQSDPQFWAGGKFIDPPTDQFASLPYWNRHHVPSLTYCDNGDLLATVFTAPFDNSDQMAILITRLRHGEKNWDAAARFFVAPDRNVTSATLFNAGDGTIHHYNGLGNNLCEDFSMIKRISRDNGATWSEAKIVNRFPNKPASPENPSGSPRLWPHMDLKSCTDAEGNRILLMSTDVGAGNELGSAVFISRDEGESWQEQTRTNWQSENFAIDGKEAGWIAGIHAPVELGPDRSLLAIGRSNNIAGFAPLSRSADFGKTWTYSASPFPPILSGQRSVLLRLEEGPLLFISFTDSSVNVREGNISGMPFFDAKGNTTTGSGIFAALSFDNGETWPKKKLIPNWDKRPWKSRYSGYLSSVQSPDRMIHLVNSKFYYRFNLAWLKEAMPAKTKRLTATRWNKLGEARPWSSKGHLAKSAAWQNSGRKPNQQHQRRRLGNGTGSQRK